MPPSIAGPSFKPALLSLVAVVSLFFSRPADAQEEDSLAYKFQFYDEEDDRIEVESHYVQLQVGLPHEFTFTAKALTNIITGATPTGLLDPADPDELGFTEIDDRRDAFVVSLGKTFGDHTFTFEYARSVEEDYISNGYALRSEHALNNQNTILTFGASYNDDLVTAETLPDDRRKETMDFVIGVSQLLDPKTILEATVTLGYSRGYLGDPYKSISQKQTFMIPDFPPFEQDVPYFENRPDERLRFVFRLGLLHYVEPLKGSVDAHYRFFRDDAGLEAHTLGIAWNQKIGDKLVITPYYRWYHQSEADYYGVNLDDAPFEPNDDRTGRAPFYSADYRLSNFDAHTFGIEVAWFPTDWLTIDAAYERYAMYGNDHVTRASAYPKANVFTIGARADF